MKNTNEYTIGEQNNDVSEKEYENQDKGDTFTETVIQSEELTDSVKTIRVLLMDSDYESYYHPSVTVDYDGKEETYTLESELLHDGELLIECDGEGIAISSIKRSQGTPVYKGSIKIKKTEKGLLLINELPIEQYLESVVPSEMPSSYEKEALKAQAVCARTYAYKQIEKQSLKEYEADVDDSVNYQVYENVARQDSTNEAVHETKNEILMQGDELIEAYYFSTSSGMTSTDEVWGVQEVSSFLKSVECKYDLNTRWSDWNVKIPWENLEKKINEKENINGKLLNIQLMRKSESGAVLNMDIITEKGNINIAGEYNVRSFFSPYGCEIIGENGLEVSGGNLLPSAYFDMKVIPGECVEISGRGYGHGVGMSQNGANEMAKNGYNYEGILEYFFNDIKIKKNLS